MRGTVAKRLARAAGRLADPDLSGNIYAVGHHGRYCIPNVQYVAGSYQAILRAFKKAYRINKRNPV